MLSSVNFVSHAAVASWYDASPHFVLGAMLPDFFGMLRIRTATPEDGELARGVRFHHLSDEAFHESRSFVALTHDAREWLRAKGLPKGPARAVAHIGVELLLDPLLLATEAARRAYLEALSGASRAVEALGLTAPDKDRFNDLTELLRARGIPDAARTRETTVLRIRRALAQRPRLAFDDAGEALVRNWVVVAEPSVVGCAPDVIRQLLTKLDGQGFGRASREASFT